MEIITRSPPGRRAAGSLRPAARESATARPERLSFLKALDVDIDDVRQRIVRIVPDMLRDIGAADDLPLTPHQMLEQRKLACGQRHALAINEQLAGTIRSSGCPAQTRSGATGTAAAAHERADSRQQLPEVERFRYVVVGAAIKPGNACVDAVPSRQHQDRDIPCRRRAGRGRRRGRCAQEASHRARQCRNRRRPGARRRQRHRGRRPRRKRLRASLSPETAPSPARLRREARASPGTCCKSRAVRSGDKKTVMVRVALRRSQRISNTKWPTAAAALSDEVHPGDR